MEDIKYQVFISSTYRDMMKAREKVIETILGLYHFPVGMEMFSAADEEQWEIIKETINYSDYYILILGHRYGSETADGISFTEKEYDYAISQGVPVLAFIRERNIPTKPEEREDIPDKIRKLTEFLGKATQNKMCDFWSNEDELAAKVAIALPKAFRRNSRIGWVRADRAITAEVSNEIARLSKENSDLRHDVEVLTSKVGMKKPMIELKVNGGLEFSFTRKPVTVSRPKKLDYPQELNRDEVANHLKPYISVKEVNEYNSKLPSNEEVDLYNEQLHMFFEIKQNVQPFEISITNTGSVKAHDVIIDVEFPYEFKIISKETAESPPPPENPMPPSLVFKAQKEYEKEQKRLKSPLQYPLQARIRDYSMVTPISNHFEHLMSRLDKKQVPEITSYENRIHIRLESLLHTRKTLFDDYSVVPLVPGEFIIKASVICEEYDEENKVELHVEVRENEVGLF